MKRNLTEEEIEYLLKDFSEHIPRFNTIEINDRYIASVKEPLVKELRTVQIINHPDYIEKLRQKLLMHWKKSIIPAGESVGVICAQSIGERQTQLTLNSFHQSGLSVATVVSGVPRFLELLNATKELKVTSNLFSIRKNMNRPSDIRRFMGNTLISVLLGELVIKDTIHFDKEDEYWYDAFEIVYNNGFRDYHSCITFILDIQLLFQYQITLYDIKHRIEMNYSDVFVVFSPFHLGQIDVFIDLTNIQLKQVDETIPSFLNQNNYEQVYVEDVVKPRLLEIKVAGIDNIKKYHITKNDDEKSHHRWIIQTEGSNLRELLSLSFVQPDTAISNNMWEIYDIMGIEAVREFLIQEFTNVVSSDGTFINRCHILLLVDMMTFHGSINSISRYGMKKEQIGVLSRSSFEESLDHFANAAFYSEKEPVQAVSASIMCGKRSNIGSGLCKLIMDWDKISQLD